MSKRKHIPNPNGRPVKNIIPPMNDVNPEELAKALMTTPPRAVNRKNDKNVENKQQKPLKPKTMEKDGY